MRWWHPGLSTDAEVCRFAYKLYRAREWSGGGELIGMPPSIKLRPWRVGRDRGMRLRDYAIS